MVSSPPEITQPFASGNPEILLVPVPIFLTGRTKYGGTFRLHRTFDQTKLINLGRACHLDVDKIQNMKTETWFLQDT